jgi:hypothetical protein
MKRKKELVVAAVFIIGGMLIGSTLAWLIFPSKAKPAVPEGSLVTQTTGQGKTLEDKFYFDIERYKDVDQKLIKWTQAEEIKTGLKEVYCLAVAAGTDVCVGGENGIEEYRGGKLLQAVKTENPVTGLVFSEGLFYAAQKDSVSVFKGKTPSAVWGVRGKNTEKGGFDYITSLAASKTSLFVADAGNRVIYRFDKTGKLEKVIRGNPKFILPSPHFDIAVKGGFLYVTNPGEHLIEKYNLDGKFIGSWGKFGMELDGFSGCCNPTNILVLDDGRVITSEKGLPRIKTYNADGKFLEAVAGPRAFDGACVFMDLDVDAKGRIYSLDSARRSVRVFERRKK